MTEYKRTSLFQQPKKLILHVRLTPTKLFLKPLRRKFLQRAFTPQAAKRHRKMWLLALYVEQTVLKRVECLLNNKLLFAHQMQNP